MSRPLLSLTLPAPSPPQIFLHLVELIFIVTLLAFQAARLTDTMQVSHERQLAFAALCGFLTLTSQMLYVGAGEMGGGGRGGGACLPACSLPDDDQLDAVCECQPCDCQP